MVIMYFIIGTGSLVQESMDKRALSGDASWTGMGQRNCMTGSAGKYPEAPSLLVVRSGQDGARQRLLDCPLILACPARTALHMSRGFEHGPTSGAVTGDIERMSCASLQESVLQ